jgi:hypothetical protein
MLAGLGVTHGLLVRWYDNLLARYNRHVASLASVPDEARESIYQEALQYQAALQVLASLRKGAEPDWDNREELEYYLDWETEKPLFSQSTTE